MHLSLQQCPKLLPYRPNRCLRDPLAMTRMPVKFGHAPAWISASVGKFTSRTSLLAEEQRALKQRQVGSTQGFLPGASVPAAMRDSVGSRASPTHLRCNLTSVDVSLRDLLGRSARLLSVCFKTIFCSFFNLKWDKVGSFSRGRQRGASQRAAATPRSV